jgi:hypothetical protein
MALSPRSATRSSLRALTEALTQRGSARPGRVPVDPSFAGSDPVVYASADDAGPVIRVRLACGTDIVLARGCE